MNDAATSGGSADSAAQRIADAVLAVPGVAGLHGGVFGEIATYLPGGRVSGVALTDSDGEIHIVVDSTTDLLAIADRARDAAAAVAGLPISVTVEDIAAPGQPLPPAPDDQNPATSPTSRGERS
ncbi:hypothetical protein [Gordonia soli]|uniref:Asp23/Gls24 family envelope stress response protein n=1 Tax=Gordonia soli NBRC 108243 TaxID=1223545 RepID=M0QDF6_9ACTN|nr:hypothetical protein [Gordonia soli]GAC66464.1 hypothetical protein GS4_02_01750 [Gordonia soli NBRC 108243]